MFTSVEIGNFFIKKSLSTGVPLTPMKLIKMVYIAHGWHLAITGEPLLSEAVQAWRYGPVIVELYQSVKHYGAGNITSLITTYTEDGSLTPIIENDNHENSEVIEILERIWEVYSKYDGLQLSSITHEDGSPWDTVYNSPKGTQGSDIIANDVIKKYYNEKLLSNAAA